MRNLVLIWSHPRTVFQSLREEPDSATALLLAGIAGAAQELRVIMMNSVGTEVGFPAIVIILANVVVGFLLGVIAFFLFPPVLRFALRLLSVSAHTDDLRVAYGWACVPYVPLLFVLLIISVAFPEDFVFRDMREVFTNVSTWTLAAIYFLYAILGGIMAIWSFVLLVIGISVFAETSRWRSFGGILLAGILLIAVFLGLTLVASLVFGGHP
jgi:hypothetical protein